ncbi:MAG TPA: hypothetical protein PLD54_01180 [Candidatus Levybacteria bacterium]|nr:hypothetical protein [Candidatus Levybacteria bacterium]
MNVKQLTAGLATTAYLFAFAPKAFADETDITFYGNLFEFSTNPQDLIAFFVNAAFVVAILLALLYLIWGGINWIMSGGDKEKVGAARSKIIAAIVGLILVIFSYVILNFVLVIMTGQGINGLKLPTLMGEGGANPSGGVLR